MIKQHAWLGIAMTALVVSGCSDDFDSLDSLEAERLARDPGVEPALVHQAATSTMTGELTLTVFLHPEASGSAEVWLYELVPQFGFDSAVEVESDVSFPLELEPGDFKRARLSYVMSQRQGCEHVLHGTVYDSLSNDLTEVFSTGAHVPDCN